jgi:hypothetical protein
VTTTAPEWDTTLVVIAKQPVPGGVKTRLVPPCTYQQAAALDERIAGAFAAVHGPALLIGVNTPQVSPALLAVDWTAADAVFGPAADGGFWALGLRVPDPALLLGVPMSTRSTGAIQRARLLRAGLRVINLPRLRDVDTVADAVAVARQAPRSRFAVRARELACVLRPAGGAVGEAAPGEEAAAPGQTA